MTAGVLLWTAQSIRSGLLAAAFWGLGLGLSGQLLFGLWRVLRRVRATRRGLTARFGGRVVPDRWRGAWLALQYAAWGLALSWGSYRVRPTHQITGRLLEYLSGAAIAASAAQLWTPALVRRRRQARADRKAVLTALATDLRLLAAARASESAAAGDTLTR